MLALVVRLLALLLATAAFAAEPDRALLKEHGLTPSAESLGAYLRAVGVAEEERAIAAKAVKDLGADDPATRHEALLRLSALLGSPIVELRAAAASPDPDVRRVARRLLEDALRKVRRHVLLAVLRTIADDRVPGLATRVLGVAPLAAELRLLPSVTAALRGTLGEGDLAALRLAAAGGDPATRLAAVRALGAAPGAGAEEAAPYLGAADERIRLAAALAFADRGDRRAVEALFALLSAEAPEVRRDAADALRATRGGGNGFDAVAAPASRRDAAAAWRKWLDAQPADAGWEHPLPLRTPHLGRTLISVYNTNRVLEVDADGHRTFEVAGIEGPWALQGLPNGHRLVALYNGRAIVEYDDGGAEVGRIRVPGQPGGFQRLENGNTLVAIADQKRIVELRPDGSLAAEHAVKGQPLDARLLENGRLLVCTNNPPQVVEMERTGEVVWSVHGQQPVTAQRLENGHTLVAESGNPGRAVEYDAAGNVVWEIAGLQICYSADRLPDGSTLIADGRGVREVAPDGKERWLFESKAYSRASRY